MTQESFQYWLWGLFEITEGSEQDPCQTGLTPAQAQIIKDHLKLTFSKVTPQRAPRPTVFPEYDPFKTEEGRLCSNIVPKEASEATYCSSSPEKPTSIKLDGHLFPGKIYTPEETAKLFSGCRRNGVYITISDEPLYHEGTTYSYYPCSASCGAAQGELLKRLGLEREPGDVYCVVDNTLRPAPTVYNKMSGGDNHLTMPGPNGFGIVNVGTGEPLAC